MRPGTGCPRRPGPAGGPTVRRWTPSSRALRLAEAPFDVASLTIPATYGVGSKSVERYRRTATWLLEHTPGSELIEIDGASHGAHLTHPDAFAALVRSAMARSGQTPVHGTP